jgi:serine/threonine protein phosphatase PrpC
MPVSLIEKNCHICSLKGRRRSNEDNHCVIQNLDNKYKHLNCVDLYSIFDGHGGKEISDYISKTLPYYFVHKKMKYPLNYELVNTIYNYVETDLETELKKKSMQCGSTALILIMFEYASKSNSKPQKCLTVLNVGDCRAVLCRNNLAIPLTNDHKPNSFNELNRIESLGGEITFDGYDWRIHDLSVSRAFGDVVSKPFVSHLPEMFTYKLKPYDSFIILACDGLWDVMTNQEAVDYVLKLRKDNVNKENISNLLSNEALRLGSMDNLTVIVVFL